MPQHQYTAKKKPMPKCTNANITHTLTLTDAEAYQIFVLSCRSEGGDMFPLGTDVKGEPPRAYQFFDVDTQGRFSRLHGEHVSPLDELS